jgi:nucleoside-diphosphate-sugar epimerase
MLAHASGATGDPHESIGTVSQRLYEPRARPERGLILATMRALVTGGAGFIGSHLSELLLDGGFEVFALDDLSTGDEANVTQLRDREGFHLVVDSVLSQSVVSELVHRCDVVYHLAAAVGVRLIVEQPGRTLLTNVQGAENVLEYCARFEKPVLIASSSEVYGNHPEDVLLEEDAQRIYGPTTAKRWAYADTKALDEFLALALRHERGLRCVIARLFNTVGPRQNSRYGNVIPRFVQNALAGEPLEIHGDGSQTRCFCHVSDVVRALNGLAQLADGEIYNVGSTDRIMIRALAEQVLEITGSGSELAFVPYEEVFEGGVTEEMFHRAPAIGKIKNAIGWEPTLGLDRILADVIESVRLAPAG